MTTQARIENLSFSSSRRSTMNETTKAELHSTASNLVASISEAGRSLALASGCCSYTDRRGRPVTAPMDEYTCRAHLGTWTAGACINPMDGPDLPEYEDEDIPKLHAILEELNTRRASEVL